MGIDMMPFVVLALVADPTWPDLVQKPHARLALQDLGLKPLLETADGGKITTREGWEKQRQPGWTGMGKMAFDASRCIDFLETLPAVDRSRIGCIGHSLGA